MKNIILKSAVLSLILSMASCNSIWDLNLEPGKPVYDGEGMEGTIKGTLTAAYSMLLYSEVMGEYYWGWIGGMDTDESFRYNVVTNNTILNAHNIVPSTTGVREFWKNLYKINEFCNTAIMMSKTCTDMTKEELDDICGQAMVLKAFSHFTLAVNYGPVPIKDVSSYDMGLETALERSPVKDVCQYALDLCRDAIPMLKSIDQVGSSGQITKSAAEALSYRIALYMASHPDIQDTEKYNDVIRWADEFIANGPNRLNTKPLVIGEETLPAYARLFVNNMRSNATWNGDNPEGIWSIMFFVKSVQSGQYQGGRYKTAMRLGRQMGVPCPDQSGSSTIGYADLTYRALNILYDKYVPSEGNPYPTGDLRRDWNIPTFCYKNRIGDAMADGYTPETRYPYFKVCMPDGITCDEEAVFLPVFDRENNWTVATGNVKDVILDYGGSGYTNADGETTFTVTIPRTSRPTTMAQFNSAAGGIVGYRQGASLDAETGLQRINASNQNDGLTIDIEDGKVVSVIRLNPNAVNLGTGFSTVTERGIGKWRREYEENLPPVRERDITACHFPVLRFADVLLMAAEAHLMGSQGDRAKGLEYLNQVRRRAYGVDIDTKNPDVDFPDYTLETIMDERSRELCFEGVRRTDLIRWNAYTGSYDAINKVISGNPSNSYITYPIERLGENYEKYSILPIPSDEMGLAANTFYQNPGW